MWNWDDDDDFYYNLKVFESDFPYIWKCNLVLFAYQQYIKLAKINLETCLKEKNNSCYMQWIRLISISFNHLQTEEDFGSISHALSGKCSPLILAISSKKGSIQTTAPF